MNKSELVEAVGKTTGLAKRDAENAVNALVHTIVSEVKAGRRVAIVGFGAFRPTRRAARKGRNPQTGAPVQIRASKGVSFGASTLFKEIVNGKSPLGGPKLNPSPTLAAPATRATKAAATRSVAKKATATKAPVRKAAATRSVAKKATATKAPVRKAAATRSVARQSVRTPRATKRS